MNQEFNFLNKTNEKYLIEIDHYKSRLKSIEKLIEKENLSVYYLFNFLNLFM